MPHFGGPEYSAIIGAVLLEGDKVARAGWDSRLGYPSVDPPHWTLVVPEGLPQDTTIGERNNVNLFYCGSEGRVALVGKYMP